MGGILDLLILTQNRIIRAWMQSYSAALCMSGMWVRCLTWGTEFSPLPPLPCPSSLGARCCMFTPRRRGALFQKRQGWIVSFTLAGGEKFTWWVSCWFTFCPCQVVGGAGNKDMEQRLTGEGPERGILVSLERKEKKRKIFYWSSWGIVFFCTPYCFPCDTQTNIQLDNYRVGLASL